MPELLVGIPAALSPLVRRIVAPNPGMMTGPGTNTYLVGVDEVAVIDPGPEDESHLEAILGCGGDRIRWVVCTHTHLDHWPGAAALAKRTGAEVLAFDSRDGLEVDGSLADGDQIEATEFRLTAVHTPGHASNHLCYLLEEERLLFSGDHVMNGSTVVIRPPDGDMAAYLEQLERLKHLRLRAIAPGHGDLIGDPIAKLDEYLAHRRLREDIVVAALAEHGPATTAELLASVYADVTEERHEMARHSLWAHLRKLAGDGRATAPDVDDPDARWEMVTP
ncbi:MAG: hydrolase:Beta-lactamase-like protein [Acidimicrobiales bacterium]|nr:hydrolase:Beta-lactamase-like protein [Acidimicrobiales bacterium]